MTGLNNRAHTITELLLASVITAILVASVVGTYVFTKQIYASGIARANLQRDADIALKRIIKGGLEPGGIFRLSEARQFSIATLSRLEFWGSDNDVSSPATRWYCLNAGGTSIIYHHPGPGGGGLDETIYTVPAGAVLTLRFRQHDTTYPPPAPPGDVYSNISVCIDIGISQTVLGRNISGSATTMVNIRDHP